MLEICYFIHIIERDLMVVSYSININKDFLVSQLLTILDKEIIIIIELLKVVSFYTHGIKGFTSSYQV